MIVGLALLAFAIWVYLVGFRGLFWLASERDDWQGVRPTVWPRIAVVIPARNEAEGIADAVSSLLGQDYPGECRIFVVDDNSTDSTAAVAAAAATALRQEGRLEVLTGAPLPPGWTGKLWALRQGIERASTGQPDYLLLTDADITYRPGVLVDLVARAEARGLVLTSLMAKLRCTTFAERCQVPAFILFFQMLYPFPWVNRADEPTAAAAGGCMLVRAEALNRIGGIESIRTALIDDCALAAKLKAIGPIWLGLTERVHSIRSYSEFDDIRHMVARSAYAQLRYSPLNLIGTTLGMAVTYLAPPLLTFFAHGPAALLGISAWTMMAMAFQPTLRFYGQNPLWGPALPAIAFLYMAYTLDSAYQYASGRGGTWKGRAQANLAGQ